MHVDSVIKYFGGNQSAVARALGVTKATVSKWKKLKLVPPLPAARIERITHGKLRFDPDKYPGGPAGMGR